MMRVVIATCVLTCACSTQPPRDTPHVSVTRQRAMVPAGDASMFHRDRFADAGVVVDEPVACERDTWRIVVHGRGHHHLAHRLPPECKDAHATCDDVDENVFWNDLSARWHGPIGGADCGDRPRVGGLVGYDVGWYAADGAVAIIVEVLMKWDVDADIAYYVAPPLPEAHLL